MNERVFDSVTSEASVYVESRMNEILTEKAPGASGGRAADRAQAAAKAAIYTWFEQNHPVVTADDAEWTDAPVGSEMFGVLKETPRIESDWDVLAVLRLGYGRDLDATRELARTFYDALAPAMAAMTSAQRRARIEAAHADAARFASYLDPEDEQ